MRGIIETSGSDLFKVDNSDNDWKGRDYLKEWAELAHSFDIATGYFEICALLAMAGRSAKERRAAGAKDRSYNEQVEC